MARLTIAGRTFDVDGIVFDKDGTLVDFDRLWAGKLKRAVNALIAECDGREGLVSPLLDTLGIDRKSGKVIAESPMAVSSLPKLGVIATTVLYQQGIPWHRAETLTRDIFMPIIDAPPGDDDLVPIGDVTGLLARFDAAGLRLAILTSDDRAPTLASLPMLGITHLIRATGCGDDPVPNKPHPDGLLAVAATLGLAPARLLMVGDSVTDMRTGRAAGVAGCIGVLSGTGTRDDLAAHGDVVITDIHDMLITAQ